MSGRVFLVLTKTRTFDLSETWILIPRPLTHAKEKGTRRGSKPQRVKGLGKVILETSGDAGLFIFRCLLKRYYLMSTFETVLGSSAREALALGPSI